MTEIQVVMTDGIQEAFKTWLASRGLYLFPIPVEDDPPTFGIGIGDPLDLIEHHDAAREASGEGRMVPQAWIDEQRRLGLWV